MSIILGKVEALGHVMAVDDERGIGNSIIVTLNEPWCFRADPGCGVRGFDTVAETKAGCALAQCYRKDQA